MEVVAVIPLPDCIQDSSKQPTSHHLTGEAPVEESTHEEQR